MWPFRAKRREADRALLEKLLDSELKRQERIADLELKKLDLEYSHLEARASVERENLKLKEELRQKRRETAAARPRGPRGEFRAAASGSACRVCADPTYVGLSADEILFHNAGHSKSTNGYRLDS